MNDYAPGTPRLAFGLAAFAMTALTLTTLVVLPAEFEMGNLDASLVSAAYAVTAETNPVNVLPGRKDPAAAEDDARAVMTCEMLDVPSARAKHAKLGEQD
jgi:hypothetical protein